MRNSSSSSTTRRAAFIGLLACLSIAMTAWAVGASEPAEETVDRARRAAERAAAAESAVSELEGAGAGASPLKRGGEFRQFGDHFSPAELSLLPEDWQKAGLDLQKAHREDGELVQKLPSGLEVVFTVDPKIQAHLEDLLDDYEVPHGGVTLVEPDSGRVLAMVSHSRDTPEMPHLARRSAAPAASTFKVVTAAALIETAGFRPDNETCYHGGASHLTEENIVGTSQKDDRCRDLGDALAWSINSIIAKLSHRHLEREDLRTWAKRFGYNTDIPFELPVERSTAEIVRDPIERARTAAGFWHTYLSPLHGALIGAALENGGLLMRPSIIETVRTPNGKVLKQFDKKVLRRVMDERTAEILSRLLEGTTSKGTASHRFDGRAAFPANVRTAGKTGTLANHAPYLSFTWFVGFGRHLGISSRDAAVGSLLCNTPKWRIKGPYAASEGLRKFFELEKLRAERESDSQEQLAEK